MSRHRIDPLTLARMKRELRCPDCDSIVRIDRTEPERASVAHDDSCPALAALTHQGRTTQVVVVRGAEQPAADYAADVAEIAKALHDATGLPLRVATTPYADLWTEGKP